MSGKRFIDYISVKSPCGESWEGMEGNSKVRFCSHCAKNVTNISEMTSAEARRFVLKSGGNICVRIIRDKQNSRASSVDRPIYQISRAPIFATGLMVASLAASGHVVGQTPVPANSAPVIESPLADNDPEPVENGIVTLKGKITDSGATKDDEVWLGQLSVRVIRQDDGTVGAETQVDEDGAYEFSDLPPGIYELRVDPVGGFQKKIILNVQILPGHVTEQNIDLKRSGLAGRMGYGFGGAMMIPQFTNDLVQAASESDEKMIRMLLRSGANPNGADPNYGGISALFQAVENNDLPIAKLLLRYGARVNQSDSSGDTALSRIEKETSVELVKLLVRGGADLSLKDSDGMTPLMNAIEVGNEAVVKLLVESGANVSETDEKGNTALMMAAANDDLEIVTFLIEYDAEINSENKFGENAFDVTGSEEIEELLLSKGSRAMQADFSNATPRLITEADRKASDDTQESDPDEPGIEKVQDTTRS